MDGSENNSESSWGGPDQVERWRTLRDATWQALATAERPPGARPWAELSPFDQAMMVALKMAHENEDFRKEVAKHIS